MSWKIDFTKINKKYAGRIDLLIQKSTFDLFSRVIMRSPVDTGRFRNNWQFGINQIPTGEVAGTDKGVVNQVGIGASSAKSTVAGSIGKVRGGDVVYLVNNLPYAERLEDNWSPQTHNAGIVGVSVAEFQGIVDKVGGELSKT